MESPETSNAKLKAQVLTLTFRTFVTFSYVSYQTESRFGKWIVACEPSYSVRQRGFEKERTFQLSLKNSVLHIGLLSAFIQICIQSYEKG